MSPITQEYNTNKLIMTSSTIKTQKQLENHTTRHHLSFMQGLKTDHLHVVYSPIGYLNQHARIKLRTGCMIKSPNRSSRLKQLKAVYLE